MKLLVGEDVVDVERPRGNWVPHHVLQLTSYWTLPLFAVSCHRDLVGLLHLLFLQLLINLWRQFLRLLILLRSLFRFQ